MAKMKWRGAPRCLSLSQTFLRLWFSVGRALHLGWDNKDERWKERRTRINRDINKAPLWVRQVLAIFCHLQKNPPARPPFELSCRKGKTFWAPLILLSCDKWRKDSKQIKCSCLWYHHMFSGWTKRDSILHLEFYNWTPKFGKETRTSIELFLVKFISLHVTSLFSKGTIMSVCVGAYQGSSALRFDSIWSSELHSFKCQD